MCFILAVFQVNPRYPLIIAANREESRSRPSTPPFFWPEVPRLWAGRDEVAGGTWLGVNERGLLAAITNRRVGVNNPAAPSRGLLCLGVLRQLLPRAAQELVSQELSKRSYNPFNLLCANPEEGWVGTWRGDILPLAPGTHVLTNRGDLDDPDQPVIQRAMQLAGCFDLATMRLDALLDGLGGLCADTEGPDPICRAGGDRGTVSSSLIAIQTDGAVAAYWHADGPPCEVPYRAIKLEG